MVSSRCKIIVKEALSRLGLHFVIVDLGEVDVMENLSKVQLQALQEDLQQSGLEIMEDKRAILIEKIKQTIIHLIHHREEDIKINFSHYLSQKLSYDYTHLANIFSEASGTTIEQYMIAHKIERIKELLIYNELNITEIAWKMNYSSVAHLSNQFKKVTGLTPTHFKKLKERKRTAIEDI